MPADALPPTRAHAKRRRWLRWLVEACVILGVLLAVNWYRTRDVASGQAPIIAGPLIDGSQVTLGDYRGRPLLIHFWATWCPICRAEESNVVALAGKHQVLTVAMQSGGAAEVAAYLNKHELQFPVMVDEAGRIARRFGVVAVPTSFIVDANGRIRFVEVGYTTEIGLRVRLWLAGKLY